MVYDHHSAMQSRGPSNVGGGVDTDFGSHVELLHGVANLLTRFLSTRSRSKDPSGAALHGVENLSVLVLTCGRSQGSIVVRSEGTPVSTSFGSITVFSM